jgi:hypothetical protein
MPFKPGTSPPMISTGTRFSQAELDAIDAWRQQQADQPNRCAAIRQLVRLTLKEQP